MMDSVNYIKLVFSYFTLNIILLSGLINSFEKYLPPPIIEMMRYGKFAYNGKKASILKVPQVPKSWFRHFYVYSSILTCCTLLFVSNIYLLNFNVPDWLLNALDTVGGVDRQASVSSAATLLATILLTLQCCRRFYDTQYVSVFGKNSYMNIFHYLVGLLHYTGAVLAILVEAPKFAKSTGNESSLSWADLSYTDFMAGLIFVWAWWHQYKATVILSNLRKNKKGSVVTQEHKLPQGDLFEYISSPHLSCEILMYIALSVILWNNSTWLYILAWVLCNQVETALLSYWWYQEKFADFPKHRKAIIPFIY